MPSSPSPLSEPPCLPRPVSENVPAEPSGRPSCLVVNARGVRLIGQLHAHRSPGYHEPRAAATRPCGNTGLAPGRLTGCDPGDRAASGADRVRTSTRRSRSTATRSGSRRSPTGARTAAASSCSRRDGRRWSCSTRHRRRPSTRSRPGAACREPSASRSRSQTASRPRSGSSLPAPSGSRLLLHAPWGGRNARVRAPDGMQLTLFTAD